MSPNETPPPKGQNLEIFVDSKTRVTRHTLLPGQSTGSHSHEFDYVVVPVLGGTVLVEIETSSFEFTLTAREPYSRESGVIHSLTNISDSIIDFFEVEYLENQSPS